MAASIISFQGFAIIFILSACVDINQYTFPHVFTFLFDCKKDANTHTHVAGFDISKTFSSTQSPFVRSFV
jgi:hypothetical protein